MKIDANKALRIISKMEEESMPGNKVCDEVQVGERGEILAYGFSCDKDGCNCVGGWWSGDKYAGTNFKLNELEAIASNINS